MEADISILLKTGHFYFALTQCSPHLRCITTDALRRTMAKRSLDGSLNKSVYHSHYSEKDVKT